MKVVICGRTNVVRNHLEDDEQDVTDPEILKMIASKNDVLADLSEPDLLFPEFINDGTELGETVSQAVGGGGWVSLGYEAGSGHLLVTTEYDLKRPLNKQELEYLVKDTVGQWSDGGGGAAMDDFAEHIEPYYVDVYPFLDDYDADNPVVNVIED